MYGRVEILKRVLEKSTKQSHAFSASRSFSTEGAYGGGGESQQNSSRVKIFDRDLKRVHVQCSTFTSQSFVFFLFFFVFGLVATYFVFGFD